MLRGGNYTETFTSGGNVHFASILESSVFYESKLRSAYSKYLTAEKLLNLIVTNFSQM